MPNNCLSVLYKHIIQVENKNVGLKVWGGGTNIPLPPNQKSGGGGTCPPWPPPPPLPTPVLVFIRERLSNKKRIELTNFGQSVLKT